MATLEIYGCAHAACMRSPAESLHNELQFLDSDGTEPWQMLAWHRRLRTAATVQNPCLLMCYVLRSKDRCRCVIASTMV